MPKRMHAMLRVTDGAWPVPVHRTAFALDIAERFELDGPARLHLGHGKASFAASSLARMRSPRSTATAACKHRSGTTTACAICHMYDFISPANLACPLIRPFPEG